MSSWTHLVRFIAVEDSQVHLGQLVDTARDVGRDTADGVRIAVKLIEGTVFDGRVTEEILHVKQVRAAWRYLQFIFRSSADMEQF
jgi:IMP cyclohydrolase